MCISCQVLSINGITCHETGCPNAYKDSQSECKWCGQLFTPESKYQDCCSHSCNVAYLNLSCDCDECNQID